MDVITEDTIDYIIQKVHKEIRENIINWEFKDGVYKFRVNVENNENIPLRIIGTYNHRNGSFSFTLIFKNRRIRGLDCGEYKYHHNKDCTKIKGKHKHKWTDDSEDKFAYVPEDIDCEDIQQSFYAFLRECQIKFRGVLRKPYIPRRITDY